MEKRIFGTTGYEISVIAFGAAPIGFLNTEQQQVTAILNTLLDEGVNLIDTAADAPFRFRIVRQPAVQVAKAKAVACPP